MLNAPARAEPGTPFTGQVLAYTSDGTAPPAAGATISGGGTPVTTDAAGNATVSVSAGPDPPARRLRLRNDIPSAATSVCVARRVPALRRSARR